MYCPQCGGINARQDVSCRRCGFTFQPGTRSPITQATVSRDLQLPGGAFPASRISQRVDTSTGTLVRTRPSLLPGGSTPQITGRVIAVDGPHLETGDFDLYKVLNRVIWLFLLVVSPMLVVYGTLILLGALPAVLALVGVVCLLRYLSPMNLFAIFHLAALLNPLRRSQAEQVPVRFLRVRDLETLEERVVRIKGTLAAGNVMPDDQITAYGAFRKGVFCADHAYSHRTQAWIHVQQSRSWVIFAISIILLALLFAMFYPPAVTLWQHISMGVLP